MIEAVGRLNSEGRLGDAVLIVAGDAQGRDDYADGLRTLANELGVGDRVRLVGHVDDIAAAYATARVTAVASIEPEAFGRAAAEALAVGCPTITTNIGAPPEIVLAPPQVPRDQATGWHVPPRDASALAEALAEALSLTDAARDAMGDACDRLDRRSFYRRDDEAPHAGGLRWPSRHRSRTAVHLAGSLPDHCIWL